MYTDDDLNRAVEQGVFTETSVVAFRQLMAAHTPPADEENFRLIGGFNDLFVVIACVLTLFSVNWVIGQISPGLGLATVAALAWGLAEVFVARRKMALPAIVLLLAFAGGVFGCVLAVLPVAGHYGMLLASAVTAMATYAHWRRFRVPLTVAVCVAAGLGMLFAGYLWLFSDYGRWMLTLIFLFGLAAFSLAMFWDASDRARTTHRSDVAFWLHMLAAPMIVHPVFAYAGLLNGQEGLTGMAMVSALYLVMVGVSLIIDRRVLMVSSLSYVLYSLAQVIEEFGGLGQGFAVTGLIIGASLLLLSVCWQRARRLLVGSLPVAINRYVPAVH